MPRESFSTPSCPREAVFVEHIEGRLDASSVARLEAHLGACTACSALVDDLVMAALEPPAIDVEDRIARALMEGCATSPASTDPTAPALGQIVGGTYRIVRLIGAGGMGAVYEAEHTGTGERVAVKLISRRLLAASGDAPSRFRREARAAAALDSPHIVRVVDSGADEVTSQLYLVMEYLRGEDLQQLIDRAGPLRPDAALRIAAQALVGLMETHAAGIVHRDIKPANLFLARVTTGAPPRGREREVTVKLLDFGIAKVAPGPLGMPHTTGLTRTGGLLGSPLYMSPEQVQNSSDVDRRTDLWSLGSALYAALSGRAPHGDVDSVGKLILAICGSPAPPIRERAPWVTLRIAEVVHGALEIDREARYPSAAAMLEALRPLVGGDLALREEMLVGVTLEERTRVSVAPLPAGAPPPPTGGRPEARSGRFRWGTPPIPRVARVAAGVTLALGIVLAGIWSERPRPPARPASSPAPPAIDAPEDVAPPPRLTAEPIRRVLLVVFPEDAAVEVDGARAQVQAGAVELAGALGSEHRIRVSKGEAAIVANVVVTEKGAAPPKVDLPPTRPRASAGKPAARSVPLMSPEPRDEDVMRKAE